MSNTDNPPAAERDIVRSVIDDLLVSVEAVLGVTQVKVRDLSHLAEGDVFTLDAQLADLVELRMNGVVIALGELVSMGDRFAVRIQKLATSS